MEAETTEKTVTDFFNIISPTIPVEPVLNENGNKDYTQNVIERLSTKMPLKPILSTSLSSN
jgi:hypothetical protein